ncbi:hypothetical protein COCCU_10405 [Corynebacterium occultum]|uniref:EpsG family protein n=1 Tax=Corynebacterium occultum TaxID=2675219 RepID=A0A6B8WDC8_9CORY|nr:EpsG family protein [Corynebacterium occultum]QGU08000.1 hypothetical protein COCCU_10405 [Corynebacterium occultum]
MTYSIVSIFGFFAIISLCALATSKLIGLTRTISAHVLAIAIAWFYGFRSPNVGADTEEYIDRFLDETVTSDFLFSYAGILLKKVGLDSSQYLFALALATSLLLLHAIKNFTQDYSSASLYLALAAILPYGIMQYINISRQGLAVAIVLYGISLIQHKSSVRGLAMPLATLFIHRTTGIIYLVSHFCKRFLSNRYGLFIAFAAMTIAFILSSYTPEILSMADADLAEKYKSYLFLNTSESPYLIYAKFLWAVFHLAIVYNLNKVKAIPPALYYYYIFVTLSGIALYPNPVVSTRLLASIDFILPVIYAIPTAEKGKDLRTIGVVSLFLYALASPFLFSMYALSFNWG